MSATSEALPRSERRRPRRKSHWPARLDFAQSTSGLALGLFMWGHMFFVSSILISNDAMWTITKMFEGYFFFGRPYSGIVSAVVAGVFILFIAHAGLAVRKFPIDYAQYRDYRDHMGMGRTATNVIGNSIATSVVAKWEGQLGEPVADAGDASAQATAS